MTPPHTTIGHGAATKAAGIHARPGPPRRHPLSPSALTAQPHVALTARPGPAISAQPGAAISARADPATIHRPGVEAVVQP